MKRRNLIIQRLAVPFQVSSAARCSHDSVIFTDRRLPSGAGITSLTHKFHRQDNLCLTTREVFIMTTSGVEGDLQMHGAQKNPLTIPTTRCPNPSTALYLVSPPLPAGVSTVQFHIVSHDQGWTDNPQGGLWTWFEVSIFRPLQSELNPDFPDVNDAKFTKSRPDDFGNMIQELGFYFAYIPGEQTEQGNTVLSSVFSLPMAKHTANRDWQHHSVTWTLGDRNGEGNQFLSLLEEGDRLAIWARAQVRRLSQE